MAETSIGVSRETKEKLQAEKPNGETWDSWLQSLVEDSPQRWTEQELRELIHEELRRAKTH